MLETKLIVAFVIGLLAHLFATLVEDSVKAKKRITIKEFMDLHPWQIPLSITLSVAAYGLFYEMNQLNMISAIAAGYMGDSIVKKAMSGVKLK